MQEALRALSSASGDYALAFRSVSGYLRGLLPVGATIALLKYDELPRLAALAAADGRVVVELTDPLNEGGDLLPLDDLLAQHLLAECGPAWLTPSALELAHSPSAMLLGLPDCVLRLPLYGQGRVQHVLLLGWPHTAAPAPRAELLERATLFANAAVALARGNVRLGELHEENQRVLAEVRDLVDVQRALQPTELAFRGLDCAVHYQPSALAGGDYYDLVALTRYYDDYPADRGDVVACMIADVSGHGAGAAMEAVQFDAILRTYQGEEGAGPAGVLSYANRHFFSRRSRGHFMTALALLIHPQQGRIQFCSAGHPPFLRIRDGHPDWHGRAMDVPLGILREHVYDNAVLDWQAGDTYVLWTDGIAEARDGGAVEFGRERIATIARGWSVSGDDTAASLCDRLITALHAHQGSPQGRDDQTLIVLRLLA